MVKAGKINTYVVRELQMIVRDAPLIPIEVEPFVGLDFSGPEMIYNLFKGLNSFPAEAFIVLHLDSKNRLSAMSTISIGTMNSALVHSREIFRAAIANLTAGIICIHAHLSGDPEPSRQDLELTQKLKKAGDIIGIRIIDHIIVGRGKYVSFHERSLI